jgi:hypothetical protein
MASAGGSSEYQSMLRSYSAGLSRKPLSDCSMGKLGLEKDVTKMLAAAEHSSALKKLIFTLTTQTTL